MNLDREAIKAIKQQIIEQFPDDDIREHEIVFQPNGEIVIDRRATHPWATPVLVGRWRS